VFENFPKGSGESAGHSREPVGIAAINKKVGDIKIKRCHWVLEKCEGNPISRMVKENEAVPKVEPTNQVCRCCSSISSMFFFDYMYH